MRASSLPDLAQAVEANIENHSPRGSAGNGAESLQQSIAPETTVSSENESRPGNDPAEVDNRNRLAKPVDDPLGRGIDSVEAAVNGRTEASADARPGVHSGDSRPQSGDLAPRTEPDGSGEPGRDAGGGDEAEKLGGDGMVTGAEKVHRDAALPAGEPETEDPIYSGEPSNQNPEPVAQNPEPFAKCWEQGASENPEPLRQNPEPVRAFDEKVHRDAAPPAGEPDDDLGEEIDADTILAPKNKLWNLETYGDRHGKRRLRRVLRFTGGDIRDELGKVTAEFDAELRNRPGRGRWAKSRQDAEHLRGIAHAIAESIKRDKKPGRRGAAVSAKRRRSDPAAEHDALPNPPQHSHGDDLPPLLM